VNDHDLNLDSHIIDIDILEKVTRLVIDMSDKQVSLTFSNSFIEKLSALIVLTRMSKNTGFDESSRKQLKQDADQLHQDIKENYGKALWSDTS